MGEYELTVDYLCNFLGPLRHPQPMSPSDLHLALEKEQEAMVSFKMNHLRLLSFPSVYSHPLSFSLPLGKSTDSRAVCSAPADSVSRINCLLLFNHERSIRHIPNLPLARQLRPLSHLPTPAVMLESECSYRGPKLTVGQYHGHCAISGIQHVAFPSDAKSRTLSDLPPPVHWVHHLLPVAGL